MKIDWFYLNSLTEADVKLMYNMFNKSAMNQNLGKWDLSKRDVEKIFNNSLYSSKQYNIHRENLKSNI